MIGMIVDGIQVPSTYTTRNKKKKLEESIIMDKAILRVLDMTRKPMLTATIAMTVVIVGAFIIFESTSLDIQMADIQGQIDTIMSKYEVGA